MGKFLKVFAPFAYLGTVDANTFHQRIVVKNSEMILFGKYQKHINESFQQQKKIKFQAALVSASEP